MSPFPMLNPPGWAKDGILPSDNPRYGPPIDFIPGKRADPPTMYCVLRSLYGIPNEHSCHGGCSL